MSALQEQHVRLALEKQESDDNARRIELQACALTRMLISMADAPFSSYVVLFSDSNGFSLRTSNSSIGCMGL